MTYSNAADNEPHPDHIVAETVRAKSFDIVDDDGSTRLSLYTADDGTPVFTMFDKGDKERLAISLDNNQRPFLVLYGEDGLRQFDVIISTQGTPHLRLFDQKQQLRAALYVDDDRPSLNFYDNQETLRMAAYLADDGCPYAILLTNKEEIQTRITVPPNGEEGLAFEDEEGKAKRVP